jgi:hypothetical protein
MSIRHGMLSGTSEVLMDDYLATSGGTPNSPDLIRQNITKVD